MNTLRRTVLWAVALAFASGWTPGAAGPAAGQAPQLTVIVVVDQLTADRTREWAHKPTATGFRRLWQDGVVYANSAYDYATTSTAPGHATIATGVQPSVHGVISNFWFDRRQGRPLASVWDGEFGVSPLRMEAPALADLLHSSYEGGGKIFSVSIKDRGAAFIAGRHGKAFWYSQETGGFVTSRFYYPDGGAPEWLSGYNDGAHRDIPQGWDLLMPVDSYRNQDDRAYERPPEGWTNVFPHTFAVRGTPEYYDQLRYAPQGDRITLGLAMAIIAQESLGADRIPDLLSISLSATDRIGHAFGPNSREAEDNLYRLDRLFADLLDSLDQRLGRERYLLVLSSDHGMSPVPESVPGFDPKATRIFPLQLTRDLNAALRTELEIEEDLVLGLASPWLYFHLDRIEENKLDLESVYDAAANWLAARPEIGDAIPVSRLDDCDSPEICALIRNSTYPGRSGEMYLVAAENSFFSWEPPVYAASHGSPKLRDRRVPIIFYGMNILPRVVARPVTPRHIAPTLASALGLPPQDHWEQPLDELAAVGKGAQRQ